jgi:ABC-type methionine transport system ATPase subunit
MLACNRTIILVTHHLTLCLPIASRVLKLDDGKILYQGTIPELESKGLLMSIIQAEEEPFPETEPLSDKPTNDADALVVENGNTEVSKLVTGKLIEAEAVAEGQVSLRTYFTYFKAGGVGLWVLIIAIQMAIRSINVVYQVRSPNRSSFILCLTSGQIRSFWRDGAKHTKMMKHLRLS